MIDDKIVIRRDVFRKSFFETKAHIVGYVPCINADWESPGSREREGKA